MMKLLHSFYHPGELVHSLTSYNSMFCSISLNEVWVKGFFFMVPHEEYGTPGHTFYDEMVGAHSYSLLEQNYRTWDPHLFHWSIFDWSLEACMHLENGGLLTWRYKNLHEFLMRHLLDVLFIMLLCTLMIYIMYS